MPVKSFIYLLLWSWVSLFSAAHAEQAHIVDHIDAIEIDPQLSLSDLVKQTLEKYPDYVLVAAMHQESDALNKRGRRWFSGAPQVVASYKDDFAGSGTGAYEFNGAVQVPVWNWGQRDAGQQLAAQAEQSASYKLKAIKLKVAGLVREALWNLKLEDLRYSMSKKEFSLAEKLLKTVQRRVEFGDLPRADFLLAQGEFLQKKTDLINQEAEVMHARKRFYFLTQSHKIPEHIEEVKSMETSISAEHPTLTAISALIARKKAQVEWIKAKGSGQTTLGIGGVTERGQRNERAINSITFSISVPFGGHAYIAPQAAAANRLYIAAEAKKTHLYRALLEQLHEAEHGLEVELAQLEIAEQLQSNAEEHLKMANLSFEAGEINLMDFLKIQGRSLGAIKSAQESAIKLQRDIAFYNQAIGVTP